MVERSILSLLFQLYHMFGDQHAASVLAFSAVGGQGLCDIDDDAHCHSSLYSSCTCNGALHTGNLRKVVS